MSEVWAAAVVTVVGGVVAGKAQEKKDKSDKKYNKEMTEEDYRRQAQETGYEAALDNYYKQKDRYEAQRGLDQFRQFSTIDNYKPGYATMDGQLTAPVMPEYNDFKVEEDPAANTGSGGGGKSGNILSKIDPLGSKLFGGLF